MVENCEWLYPLCGVGIPTRCETVATTVHSGYILGLVPVPPETLSWYMSAVVVPVV